MVHSPDVIIASPRSVWLSLPISTSTEVRISFHNEFQNPPKSAVAGIVLIQKAQSSLNLFLFLIGKGFAELLLDDISMTEKRYQRKLHHVKEHNKTKDRKDVRCASETDLK